MKEKRNSEINEGGEIANLNILIIVISDKMYIHIIEQKKCSS